MDLVDDDVAQVGEIAARAFPGAEQRQLLRRGQQDVGRVEPLALALGDAGIAGAGFDPDRQAHLLDRRRQVALHVDRQRLQRRDVEGVQAGRGVAGRPLGQLDQAGQEAGQGLAAAGGGDQQGVAALARLVDHGQLVCSRRPAAPREPRRKARRQQAVGRRLGGDMAPRLAHGSRAKVTISRASRTIGCVVRSTGAARTCGTGRGGGGAWSGIRAPPIMPIGL